MTPFATVASPLADPTTAEAAPKEGTPSAAAPNRPPREPRTPASRNIARLSDPFLKEISTLTNSKAYEESINNQITYIGKICSDKILGHIERVRRKVKLDTLYGVQDISHPLEIMLYCCLNEVVTSIVSFSTRSIACLAIGCIIPTLFSGQRSWPKEAIGKGTGRILQVALKRVCSINLSIKKINEGPVIVRRNTLIPRFCQFNYIAHV